MCKRYLLPTAIQLREFIDARSNLTLNKRAYIAGVLETIALIKLMNHAEMIESSVLCPAPGETLTQSIGAAAASFIANPPLFIDEAGEEYTHPPLSAEEESVLKMWVNQANEHESYMGEYDD